MVHALQCKQINLLYRVREPSVPTNDSHRDECCTLQQRRQTPLNPDGDGYLGAQRHHVPLDAPDVALRGQR